MATTLFADSLSRQSDSSSEHRERLLQFLMHPGSYPIPTERIALKETHISWIRIGDSRVYKVKKPVRFAFLDYGTLEARRIACEAEVRLNSRLAPGVYLGVLPIRVGPEGRLHFGGDERVVEYCVSMRRLPQDRMLDELLREGTATNADVKQILDLLVPFYAHANRGSMLDQYAMADVIEGQVRENLDGIGRSLQALEDAAGPSAIRSAAPDGLHWQRVLHRIRSAQTQFLRFRAELFKDRIRSGRICEGHGDLRPEHVCMTEPPVIFDCVEFSLSLRAADVASELGFLAMELDFLGAPKLGKALIQGYEHRSEDAIPESLLNFYKSYRACVRAKVELLRAEQGTGGVMRQARTRALRYLQLASNYTARYYRPMLFVMVGAAGTGKSTVANALAENLGLQILRTDRIRQELAGGRDQTAGYGHGMYSDSMSFWTYETLLDRAEALLSAGVSLVLDGTFRQAAERRRATELAGRYGVRLHFLRCRCPSHIARQRIEHRLLHNKGISDARPAMFDVQDKEIAAQFERQPKGMISVDTTRDLAQCLDAVLSALDKFQGTKRGMKSITRSRS